MQHINTVSVATYSSLLFDRLLLFGARNNKFNFLWKVGLFASNLQLTRALTS